MTWVVLSFRNRPPGCRAGAGIAGGYKLAHAGTSGRRIWSISAISVQVFDLLRDLKYAVRIWAKRPWHTAFSVAALAIGIGSTVGVFSMVNALLLRTLPFREAERLALIQDFIPPHDSAEQFHQWREQSEYLRDAALFEEGDVNLAGARRTTRVHVAQVSWNFFSVMGIQPIVGTTFTADAEVNGTGWGLPGSNAVAVIGYGLWQQLFGGSLKALGASLRMDGVPLTIIGVAPPAFDYPGKSVLWKAAAYSPGNNGWSTIARLKPGIPWPQARAAFAVEAQGRISQPADAVRRPRLIPLQDAVAETAKNASLVFMAAVFLILLLSCTNVANLLLARVSDRVGELSIRSALGASRARLTRQLLTESLLLSAVGSAVGLFIAWFIATLVTKLDPPPLRSQAYSIADGRVLAVIVAVSALTAIAVGVLPCLYAGRLRAFASRPGGNTRRSRQLLQFLLAGQIMLTTILLAGSLCLGRAFYRLMRIDRGYSVQGIVTASISLEGTTYQAGKGQLPYFEEVLDRIRRRPGVRSASATEFLPLYASAFVGGPFGLDGRPAKRNSTMIPILSGYFQTMGTPIVDGREFTPAEVRGGAKVAIVNEEFAAQFGSPRDVLDRQLTSEGDPPRRIVGVVKGMEYETDPTLAHSNQVFIPCSTPGGFFSTFVVRVNGRAEDQLASIRDSIQAVDPQVPVFGVKTMEQRLDEVFAKPRFYRTAVWIFAAFALLLATIGIYGIASVSVAERTRELGIRMALGRTPRQIRGMVLKQALLVVLAGALPGVVGSQFTGRILQALVGGSEPVGPSGSAVLISVFMLVAATSIWCGTRRIAVLDVITILRDESFY